MPRDIPVGNGSLLLNFDKSYNLRDIYWPHVGQALHTAGDISHTGVWVDGRFAWFDAPEWQREILYEKETLVTHVTLHHPGLQLQLVIRDCVDFNRPIFLRHILITNQADAAREVRLFFHYDWHIWDAADANTVFYYPPLQALVAYKQKAYFLMNGQVGGGMDGADGQIGISSWATGIKERNNSEGTWRDAEDGVLGRNPIAQGSVDGTLSLHLPDIPPGREAVAYHWLAVGPDLGAVIELETMLRERGPETFLTRTRHYWYRWVNKEEQDFGDLSPQLVDLYKRSLLVLRTQIDYERTMQQLQQTLWAKTQVGGMARYENDYYYQVTHDLNQAQGNPWFICTLWLAQYRIAHASTSEELRSALPLLEWAKAHALSSGVMAEQVNPFTSEPLSVSPLTWSHAEYVLTVRWYLGKCHRFATAG